MEQIVAAILMSLFARGSFVTFSEFTDEMREVVDEQVQIHLQSLSRFGEDIFERQLYSPGNLGLDGAFARVAMWISIATGIYYLGMLYRPDEPFLRWNMSVFKEHCADCVRLSGQVHTSTEWRASGWYPHAFHLECTGVHCGCFFTQVNGPSAGSF